MHIVSNNYPSLDGHFTLYMYQINWSTLNKFDTLFQFTNHTYLVEKYSFLALNITYSGLNINKQSINACSAWTDTYMWFSCNFFCSTRYLTNNTLLHHTYTHWKMLCTLTSSLQQLMQCLIFFCIQACSNLRTWPLGIYTCICL